MSRNRTPTNILELRGAFKKDPQRARKEEPKPEGQFKKTPPRHLNPEQKKTWKELTRLVAPGVLTSSDPLTVELAVVCLVKFRAMSNGGEKWDNAVLTRLSTELDKLGLSPAGRAKLTVPQKKINKYAKPE